MTDPIQESLAILHKLIQHEENMGAVYHECARQFSAHENFWQQIAMEERQHVQILQNLRPEIEAGSIRVANGVKAMESLRMFLDYQRQQYKVLTHNSLPLKTVVLMALDLEDSMVEKRFYGYFTGGVPSLTQATEALTSGTLAHIARLTTLKESL